VICFMARIKLMLLYSTSKRRKRRPD